MQIDQNIEILDSTLREGEQTPGVSFSVREKVILAKKLDLFGVDFIELGHPAVSSDVYEAVERLNDLDLNAKKMVHGRAMKSDINDALAIGVRWIESFGRKRLTMMSFGIPFLEIRSLMSISEKNIELVNE